MPTNAGRSVRGFASSARGRRRAVPSVQNGPRTTCPRPLCALQMDPLHRRAEVN